MPENSLDHNFQCIVFYKVSHKFSPEPRKEKQIPSLDGRDNRQEREEEKALFAASGTSFNTV